MGCIAPYLMSDFFKPRIIRANYVPTGLLHRVVAFTCTELRAVNFIKRVLLKCLHDFVCRWFTVSLLGLEEWWKLCIYFSQGIVTVTSQAGLFHWPLWQLFGKCNFHTPLTGWYREDFQENCFKVNTTEPIDNESTFVLVMAWCCQVINHYLDQC